MRREIEQLRERLKRAGPGMALIAVTLVLLIAGLGAVGWQLTQSSGRGGATKAAAGMCRPCADLARLEATMGESLARAGGGGIDAPDRARILDGVKSWHRRCSTLLCEARTGQVQACSVPPAALLSQLAAIDDTSKSLAARTALCAAGGCQTTQCDAVRGAGDAFGALQEELHALTENPAALAGPAHDLSTGFVFDDLGALTEAVISAPGLAAQGRFAAAQARLLFLRDAALAASASVPDSAEAQLADRLADLAQALDAMARGELKGLTGPGLGSLWHDFAEASSRILIESASVRARLPARTSAFAALASPEGGAAAFVTARAPVCNGAVRLVEATRASLAQAMGQLSLCSVRADCHPEDDATSAIPRAGAHDLTTLAAQREAALAALSALAFQKDPDVDLRTDLAQYWAREAVSVVPLSENNRCLADRGSRLVLSADRGDSTVEAVETHSLDPSDAAAWRFAAPGAPGRYRFVLQADRARGQSVFGASAPFEVVAAPAGCHGFAGTWDTDFGALTVSVREGIARGSYVQAGDERAGILQGNVDGDTLVGRWYSELGSGGTRLTLSADGQSFTGSWSQSIERTGGAGKWEGRCLNAPLASAPGQAPAQVQ